MDASGTTGRRALLLVAAAVTLTACSAIGPPSAPPLDPALRPYCEAVRRVQAEQSAPDAGRGGVTAAATAARRQVGDLARTAPPEIATEWRTVQLLTERSVAGLEATGGDARRINRAGLERVRKAAAPAQEKIKTVTQQRCGIAFGSPGP